MLRNKRKSAQISEEVNEANVTFMEAQLKKVKICATPGELCLQKDIAEARRHFPSLGIAQGANPSSIVVSLPLPAHVHVLVKFLVVVPKYYPHSAPAVTLVDHAYFSSPCVAQDGLVSHDELAAWTALCSLSSLVQILLSVCSSISLRPS